MKKKKVTKKSVRKILKVKRLDDKNNDFVTSSTEQSKKVTAKPVVKDGVVILEPINNPFDD